MTDNLYINIYGEEEEINHSFSFFRKPVRNTVPLQCITIPDIYRYIVGTFAKKQTEYLRSIQDKDEARKYKAENFDFCTFSGTFGTRKESGRSLSMGRGRSNQTKDDKRMLLLDKLPDSFTKDDYLAAVNELNLNVSTTTKWIDAFIRDGLIQRDAHGVYSKVTQSTENNTVQDEEEPNT